ncbi:GNAT family N-acetyltransferase [Pelagibius sp. CAU 1746]|uniref:GNAT family N-acetyltransferase n=1 Tax=Pelagibius sp. CAU 1746 TaxID=3140370 RepID=UPI00325A5DA6
MALGKLIPRYRLRPGKPSDAQSLLAVQDRAVRKLARGVYSDSQVESWVQGNSPERYVAAMREDREQFLVAVARLRGIVGFCAYKDEEVRSLYIDPDWSRLGLGTALLQRAEADIATAGHAKIVIGASLVGLPFYESRGYRVIRHRHWRTRGGLMIPAADMEKRLSEASFRDPAPDPTRDPARETG